MDQRVDGSATAYRLFDVGYTIDLAAAERILGDDMRGRSRPLRLEGQAIQIPNPPLFVTLGERFVQINDRHTPALLNAHLFDFGVVSMRLTVDIPRTHWMELVVLGKAFDSAPGVVELLERELETFAARLAAAIERPSLAPVREEYVVFRVYSPLAAEGTADGRAHFDDEQLISLLIHEDRPLSVAARGEMLANRFSYYHDDLTVITWDNALIVEPRRADEDVEFVLEFANAQLLELRVYDAELDEELPALYDRIEVRRRRSTLLSQRFRPLLAEVQTRVADITEIVERADNAFKVTNDVYLARIYRAALDLFREPAWRRGVDRKLQIFRDTYTMLNAESQVARAELMEIIVVVLIAAEVLLGLFH